MKILKEWFFEMLYRRSLLSVLANDSLSNDVRLLFCEENREIAFIVSRRWIDDCYLVSVPAFDFDTLQQDIYDNEFIILNGAWQTDLVSFCYKSIARKKWKVSNRFPLD